MVRRKRNRTEATGDVSDKPAADEIQTGDATRKHEPAQQDVPGAVASSTEEQLAGTKAQLAPVPGSRTWIEQQAARPPQTAKEAAATKKQKAREKRKRKRKQQKQLRQAEGWVREINAWGEKGGWIRPDSTTAAAAATATGTETKY
eukprot:COSAG02_NODE_9825_length_2099_cov_8.286000_3_plen_146_part_00